MVPLTEPRNGKKSLTLTRIDFKLSLTKFQKVNRVKQNTPIISL